MSSGPERTDWQASLAAAVTEPGLPPPPGLSAAGSDAVAARLAVYRNNALVPLVEALAESFPACRHLLGATVFQDILIRFVRAHPPTSPVLQDYGRQLPGFLALTRSGRQHPAVVDLARLELQVVQAWHAADAPVLGVADFTALLGAPEGLAQLHFTLHPAASLIESAWPLGSLWSAERLGLATDSLESPSPEAVLIHRNAWEVEVSVLDPPGASLIAALVCGASLGEALELAVAAHPGIELPDLLATLIRSRVLSAVAG